MTRIAVATTMLAGLAAVAVVPGWVVAAVAVALASVVTFAAWCCLRIAAHADRLGEDQQGDAERRAEGLHFGAICNFHTSPYPTSSERDHA